MAVRTTSLRRWPFNRARVGEHLLYKRCGGMVGKNPCGGQSHRVLEEQKDTNMDGGDGGRRGRQEAGHYGLTCHGKEFGSYVGARGILWRLLRRHMTLRLLCFPCLLILGKCTYHSELQFPGVLVGIR